MLTQEHIDALSSKPVTERGHFINGTDFVANNDAWVEVESPIDGQRLCRIPDADSETVDRAVAAARTAFKDSEWSRDPALRKRCLSQLAQLIDERAAELAVLGVRDNGTEISMAYKAEPLGAAATMRYYAGAIDQLAGEYRTPVSGKIGLVIPEPAGVVGAIVPWNFPLMIAAWKMAPALAVGNTVVIKPAETASLALRELVELTIQAGFPDGVVNLVTGRGETTGDALARHSDVDVLVFTGSGATGRKLLQASAQSNLKPVYLELGGKSPNIVFADAPDLDAAAKTACAAIFRNAGQVCIAGSRLLVQGGIEAEFTEAIVAQALKLRVGDPLRLETDIGALNSGVQLENFLRFVESGHAEGAKLLTGGERLRSNSGGYYAQPTVFSKVTKRMQIATDEVFGPLLAVMRFDDESQAIAMANDSVYGLAAGVWSGDLSRVHRMIRALQAGVVHVNCYGGADMSMPLGGVKQSGYGADKSMHALHKYTRMKSAWMHI